MRMFKLIAFAAKRPTTETDPIDTRMGLIGYAAGVGLKALKGKVEDI